MKIFTYLTDKNRQQSPSTANKQQSVSRNLFGQ